MAIASIPVNDRRQYGVTSPRQARPLTHALIVHRAPIVRAGVSALLANDVTYGVADASSVHDGLRMSATLHPQLVLFDYTQSEGPEACRLLAGIWPRPTLIALVSRPETVHPQDVLAAGADAVIAVDAVSQDAFLHVVSQAMAGAGPLVAGFRASTAAPVDAMEAVGPLAALTPREREVLYLIGEGLSNTEIADTLFLSVKTVEAHRANLSRKLNIRPRAGLIRLAMRGGLG